MLLGLLPALSGCLSHTRIVQRTEMPEITFSTSLDELLKQMNSRYDAIQTMNASVEITASVGGSRTGQIKESPSFSGYIILRKPRELRVILQLPVLGSRAMDMVSDGNNFKLYIPPRNKAIEGNETVTTPSKNGLENLRPSVFLDSFLIPGLAPGQIISETSDTHLIDSMDRKKPIIEEPDYELAVLAQPQQQVARTLRVVRIGRINLLPFNQDIYDAAGHIITRADYSGYGTFNGVEFPTRIVIRRPRDEYTLTIVIKKVTFNDKLEDDQFELKIPDSVPVQVMK